MGIIYYVICPAHREAIELGKGWGHAEVQAETVRQRVERWFTEALIENADEAAQFVLSAEIDRAVHGGGGGGNLPWAIGNVYDRRNDLRDLSWIPRQLTRCLRWLHAHTEACPLEIIHDGGDLPWWAADPPQRVFTWNQRSVEVHHDWIVWSRYGIDNELDGPAGSVETTRRHIRHYLP